MAEQYAENAECDLALKAARSIRGENDSEAGRVRQAALSKMAVRFAEAGLYNSCIATMNQMDAGASPEALVRISEICAFSNRQDRAFKVIVHAISDPKTRVWALIKAASAEMKTSPDAGRPNATGVAAGAGKDMGPAPAKAAVPLKRGD